MVDKKMQTPGIEDLKKKGYNYQQISQAIEQSKMKSASEIPFNDQSSDIDFPTPPMPSGMDIEEESPPMPPPRMATIPMQETNKIQLQQSQFQPSNRENIERMQELAESIVQEKWEDLVRNIGDINIFKEKVRTDIISIKQEIIRTHERFDNLEKALLSRVTEYNKNIGVIGSEMKALEKVMEKIIEPMTDNIKELQKIANDLKKKK
mgnify:CR=1 FL=1